MHSPDIINGVTFELDCEFDLTDVAKDSKNIVLMNDYGGFLFYPLGNGIYESHQHFLKEGRGKFVFDSAKKAVNFMFKKTDCLCLIAKIPEKYKHASVVAIKTGFYYVDSIKSPYHKDWILRNYKLDFKTWRTKSWAEQ